MGWLSLSLRRLRDERVPAIGLAVLVLATAFVFAASPRLLDRVGTGALRAEVAGATVFARNVELLQMWRIEADESDPLRGVRETGDSLAARIPAEVASLVEARRFAIDGGRWSVRKATSDPSFLRFRLQEGVEDHIRYVTGRPPTAATRKVPDVGPMASPTGTVTAIEAALSVASAERLDIHAGDTVYLEADQGDPLVGPGPVLRAAVDVVGTYEVPDPAAAFWFGDPTPIRPQIRALTFEIQYIDVTALLSADAYASFFGLTAFSHPPLRYSWRFYVDPERLDVGRLDALVIDLRRLETAFPNVNPFLNPEGTALRSGLRPLVEAHRARWASAQAVLAVVGVGPAAIAAAAMALVALLAARRRRPALALWRGRGATAAQAILSVAVEGIVLAAPAVGLGVLAAVALLPSPPALPSLVAGVAVGLAAVAILVVAALPSAVGAAPVSAHEPSVARRARPRRLVFEAAIVIVAAAAGWLLRERGVRIATQPGDLPAADPLVAAVPALVGLAAGLAAIRLLPAPMGFLSWVASARRDLVPVLGLRRATKSGGTAPVLVVLMATATIAAFSSVMLVHLERTAEGIAWQSVGAPSRVTAQVGPLPVGFEPAKLPGVEASAGALLATVTVGTRGPRFQLLALDARAYAAIVGGTPGDPGLPAEMLAPATAPVPVIVSTELATGADAIVPGEEFDLALEAYQFRARALEIRDAFPTMPIGGQWAIVSRDQLRELQPAARFLPTTAFLRAPDDATPAIRAAVADQVPGATVDGRLERAERLRTSPLLGAVRVGVAAAAVVAAVYAALAVAAALALSGASRAVEAAHLRMLGLTRREAVGLVVVEHGPTVLAAFVAGLALGLGLFVLLRPGLGLGDLLGSRLDVPLVVDVGQIALVLLGIAIIGVVGVAIGAAIQRTAVPVAALRRGIE